jgi:hypothetical protein
MEDKCLTSRPGRFTLVKQRQGWGWVGPRARLELFEKRKSSYPSWDLDRPAPSLVATPTTLPRLVATYKKGDKTKMTNNRPISLLTAFSEIFERVVFNRLHQHS